MVYNDQKTKMDRIGKKLEVECDCPYCERKEYEELIGESFDDKHFNFAENDEVPEDPYLEVERENMRAVEARNRE
jgi:hypothetical protein